MFSLRDVTMLMGIAFVLGVIIGNIVIPFLLFKVIAKKNSKTKNYIDKASKSIKKKD